MKFVYMNIQSLICLLVKNDSNFSRNHSQTKGVLKVNTLFNEFFSNFFSITLRQWINTIHHINTDFLKCFHNIFKSSWFYIIHIRERWRNVLQIGNYTIKLNTRKVECRHPVSKVKDNSVTSIITCGIKHSSQLAGIDFCFIINVSTMNSYGAFRNIR